MQSLSATLAAIVVGVATALVVLAVAILPFLNPVWVGFEQGRAQAAAWTGFAPGDLATATDAILSDLVIGPPSFDVAISGVPVLKERERQHMRDVRAVFTGLYLAAGVGAMVLGAAFFATRRSGRARLWRRISRSGVVIAAVTLGGGLLGLVFFDTAFELFHELFFPPGTYLFDERTDRLVQLFPEAFWVDTTIAVGIVVVAISMALAWLGRRRATAAGSSTASGPEGEKR
jgi:integral membrane protein (TIGR01906 family)